jgi:hypothetical protein
LKHQGPDVGTQYHPVIFYHDGQQRTIPEQVIEEIEKEKIFDRSIVTRVEPFSHSTRPRATIKTTPNVTSNRLTAGWLLHRKSQSYKNST